MAAEHPPLVALVRRGIRLQLTGMALSLALVLLVAPPARTNRLQAALLLLVGIGFVLDGRSLRANGAVLGAAQSPSPAWIPWVSGLAFVFGAAVVLCGLVFVWHPGAAP